MKLVRMGVVESNALHKVHLLLTCPPHHLLAGIDKVDPKTGCQKSYLYLSGLFISKIVANSTRGLIAFLKIGCQTMNFGLRAFLNLLT